MPWVRHGVGFTSQWKGFGGCLSGSLFCWGLGVILLLYSIFFLSGSLSFISPQTVVSGKLLLIFKRQREE